MTAPFADLEKSSPKTERRFAIWVSMTRPFANLENSFSMQSILPILMEETARLHTHLDIAKRI